MNDAVCATCGNRGERPARAGDPPEWKRAPEGWCTGAEHSEFCSIECLDGFAKRPPPPPAGSRPCPMKRALQPCEVGSRPRALVSATAALMTLAMTFPGVDPPRAFFRRPR